LNTLTKVFVVLLVVFSIAFTTMTISVVARTANWRDTAQKYQEHARIADTNLRNLIAASAADAAASDAAVNEHLRKNSQLEATVQQKETELQQMRAELARASSGKSSSEAMQRGLLGQLSSCDTTRTQYRKQRDDLEREAIDIRRRNIDLNDRVNELTARVAVMLEQKRQFEQQINILQQENTKLAQRSGGSFSSVPFEEATGVAMNSVSALSPIAATAIRGSIVDVSGDVVTLSVGASDGVKEGMIFVVHRDDQYVGDLKISITDPNRCAGRPVGKHFAPHIGDSVVDAAKLGSSPG